MKIGKRRLCVFYNKAFKFIGTEPTPEWIVCKQCQRKLARGENLKTMFDWFHGWRKSS
jgi:hypothetical protein